MKFSVALAVAILAGLCDTAIFGGSVGIKSVSADENKKDNLARQLEGEVPTVPPFGDEEVRAEEVQERQALMCDVSDPVAANFTKDSIFDPPTAAEMVLVMEAMLLYDFNDMEQEVEVEISRQSLPEIALAMQPLAGPDRTAISELFAGQSLATSALTSPGPIWGGIQTNYIARIELIPPPKANATAYLFGDGPMPGRYVRVNVNFGGLPEPSFNEYQVGPLASAPEEMTIEKLTDQIWNTRPREGNEMRALKAMVSEILNEDDFIIITSESFAGKAHGDGLSDHELAPPGLIAEERFTQIRVMFAVDGTWRGKDLNPVPLSFTINNTDVDPSMWTADLFYYNLQGPFTRDELVEAYQDDILDKVIIPESHYEEIQVSSFPQKRPEQGNRAFSDRPGPQSFMPQGARYTVKDRSINWMGWSFHAGYDFRAGPNFKNIMFKDERIAYEVALNEIGLVYTANDPIGGNVNFLDSNFGNGEYRELMKGIDCPSYATYLTNYWWAAPGGAVTANSAVCVFEVATQDTLWRRAGPFVSGVPNTELHVRFAMPNGNYDYIITYKFKLDGVLHVEAASSGYIQTYYMPPDREEKDPFSYRVSTYSGGSLHDHTLGFKVDLDIVSEANTFQTVTYKTGSALDAVNAGKAEPLTEKPEYLLFDTARWVEYGTVETEHEALMNKDPFAPKEWLFGDTTKTNKWGNTRAYHLKLDANPSSMYPENSHVFPAFSFVKQMLAVTKYKDEEQMCTGAYDLNRMSDPKGAFENFVDGENIVQEDLVAWVSLAILHLPTSENMPMTNLVKHGFTLAPWNFFDEDPAMDLKHYLRMHKGEVPGDNRKEDLPPVEMCIPVLPEYEPTFSGV